MALFGKNIIIIMNFANNKLNIGNDRNSSLFIIRRCSKVQYTYNIHREKKISLTTYERVKIAKAYIEKKYRLKKEEEREKKKGNTIHNLNRLGYDKYKDKRNEFIRD